MVVQTLEQHKDMVIGKKITAVKANSQSVYITTEDGYGIHIRLVKEVSLQPPGDMSHIVFTAVLSHQVGIPGKKKEES